MAILQTIKPLSTEFVSAMKDSVSQSYAPDGVDHIDKTINGSNDLYTSDEGREYLENNMTLVSGFLGFPNRKLRKQSGQSFGNLVRNFFGYQEDASWVRLIFNAILITPLNLIAIPFKLAVNVLKIFTEVIPATLAKFFLVLGMGLCGDAILDLKSLPNDKNRGIFNKIFTGIGKVGMFAAGALSYGVGLGFALTKFILGSFTSPVATIRNAFKTGYRSGGIVGAVVLGGIAIASVAAAYSLALPFIAQVALPIVPTIINMLPDVVVNAAINLSIAITPALSAVGTAIMPAVAFMAKVITFGIVDLSPIVASMPPIVGLGALFGGFAATIMAPLDKLVRKSKEAWHRPKNPQENTHDNSVQEARGSSHNVISQTLRNNPARENRVQVADIKESRPSIAPAPASTNNVVSIQCKKEEGPVISPRKLSR